MLGSELRGRGKGITRWGSADQHCPTDFTAGMALSLGFVQKIQGAGFRVKCVRFSGLGSGDEGFERWVHNIGTFFFIRAGLGVHPGVAMPTKLRSNINNHSGRYSEESRRGCAAS